MRGRSLVVVIAERICSLLLRRHPAARRPGEAAEIRRTFREVCDGAAARGVWPAVRTAAAELLDIARSSLRRSPAPDRLPSTSFNGPTLPSIPGDFVRAARALAASRSHAVLAIGILACGIGVNAAVFSIADSLLFRPMPFRDAARFVQVWNVDSGSGFSFPGVSPAAFAAWTEQRDLFDRVEGHDSASFVLRGDRETESIAGALVTPGLFTMLGVAPLHGRLFTADEGRPGTNRVAIISERLWRSHFGADPSVVGRSIVLNDESYTLVGIMPGSFLFPYEPQRIWAPMDPSRPDAPRRIALLARLAPGVTPERAELHVPVRGDAIHQATGSPGRVGAKLRYGSGDVDSRTKRSVVALVGAVGFLLLIVCANLASLSLSRALSRARDFAVRSALGASRARLIREALAESLLLGLAGSVCGLLVAQLVLGLCLQIMPEAMTFSSLNQIDLDLRTVMFTAAAGIAAAVLFGLPPAISASRPDVVDALKSDTRSSTATRGSRALRSGLIVAEVALSVVLLIGAALMTRSFVRLASIDTGFDPANLIALKLGLPSNGYTDPAERDRVTEDLLARAAALPGVTAVTAGTAGPDAGGIWFGTIQVEGRSDESAELVVPTYDVWPGYFEAVGLPIIEGRAFAPNDDRTAIIVGQSFADAFWPGESALGKRFKSHRVWQTIVGVAADVRQTGLDDEAGGFEWYRPLRSTPGAAAHASDDAIVEQRTLLLRAENPALVMPVLKTLVRQADPRIAILEVELVEHKLAALIARPRLVLLLMSVFAVMALVLSAAGLYGVLSMTVTQRLREIGVRLALGASPRDVRALVLRNAVWLTAAGLAIGTAAALYLLRFIRSLLYDVDAFDLGSLAIVAAVLGVVSLAAAWPPARRAMRVDPVTLFRAG